MNTSSFTDPHVVLRPLLDGTHPEPFVTLDLREDGAHVQLLYEDGALHLFLNSSGHGGSMGELRAAVAGLGLEVHRLDGHEGTEHVTLRGPKPELPDRVSEVLSAVFERPKAGEAELAGPPSERSSDRPGWGGWAVVVRRPLVASSLALVVVGGLAVGAALVRTWWVTGEWLGSPRPTPTDVALGLGGLGLSFGVGLGLYWTLLQLVERTALGDVLHRPLVGERHSLARAVTRAVRGVVSLDRGLRYLGLLGALALSLWLAFYEPLVAWILGTTGALLVAIYWIGVRRRSE